MDYGEVFTRAGRLIWKHKILWLFGLLAGCASANTGNSLSYRFDSGDLGNFQGQLPGPLQNFLLGLQQMLRQTPGWFFALAFLLICGLGLLFWLVGVYGRTGLARGAWLADSGTEPLTFSPLANESLHSFWKVALASLLTGLPGFAIGLITFMAIIFGIVNLFSERMPGLGVGLICLAVPVLCVLVPVFWLMGVWGELATVAIVGEGLGVLDGLKRSWHIFTHRFGSVLLFAVLVFIAQIVFGILLGLIFAPLGIGVILGGVLTRGTFNLGLGLVLVALLILLPIALFLGAVFHSYIGTVWALVFRRLSAAIIQPLAPLPPAVVPPSSDPVI